MWFFRAVEFLPRPTFLWVAPSVAMLVTWFLFEAHPTALFGVPLSRLGMATAAYWALSLARTYPAGASRMTELVGRPATYGLYLVFAGVLSLAVLSPDPRAIQIVWTSGTVLWVVAVGLFVFFSPEDIPELPLRWAEDHPKAKLAVEIGLVRAAFFAMVSTLVILYGSVTDWVILMTLGRIALFYLAEWVTILFVWTAPDEEA